MKEKTSMFYISRVFSYFKSKDKHASVNALAKKIILTWKCYNDQYFNYQTLLNYETDNYIGEIIDKG